MANADTNRVIAAAALKAAQRHIVKAMQEIADANKKLTDQAVIEVLESFQHKLNEVYEGIDNV